MAGNASVEVANASVVLTPKFTGVSKVIRAELSRAGLGKIGEQAGDQWEKGFESAAEPDAPEIDAKGMSKSGKKAGKGWAGGFALGGAIAGATAKIIEGIGGAVMNLGSEMVQTSDSIDKFKQTMKFAGFNQKDIDAASKANKDYADKTVYELGEINSMSATLAANGVKDFTKLTQATGNLNAVAGGNAETFSSMNMVMSQTAGAGKLTTENWNQLSDAIPGASGILMDALKDSGAYTGDFRKAMEKGEITADEFNAAIMKVGSQPIAQKAATSTGTFEGAMGNLQATVVGFGSDLLTKFKPAITSAMSSVSDILSGAFKAVLPVVDAVINSFSTWGPILGAVVGSLIAYKTIMMGITAATVAWNVVTKIAKFATAGWAVQQRLLNMALLSNPIGLIVAGIVALVAGFILAYNKIGWFRDAVNACWAGIKTAVSAVVTWFQTTVWPIMQTVFSAIGTAAMWLWTYGIKPVWTGIKIAIGAVVTWLQTSVIPWFKTAFTAVGAVFTWLYNYIIKPVWTGIKIAIAIVVAVVRGYIMAWIWLFKNVLAPVFKWLWQVIIKPAFNGIKIVIGAVVKAVRAYINGWILFFRNVLAPMFRWLYNTVVKPIWNGIKKAIYVVINAVKGYLKAWVTFFKTVVGPAFTWLKNLIVAAWNNIKANMKAIWAWIKTYVLKPIVNFLKETLGPAFTWLKTKINSVWTGIKTLLSTGWSKMKEKVFNPLSNLIKKTIPGAFETGKKAIGKAWDGIKKKVSKPVKAVIDTVYNNGIRKVWNPVAKTFGLKEIGKVEFEGFRRGGDPWSGDGKVRGPGSGTSDSINARLGRGEFVVNARSTRQHLPLLHAINGKKGKGAPKTSGGMPAFKNGGTLLQGADWWVSKGARAAEHSAFNGGKRITSGHSPNSLHYQDQAVDLNKAGTSGTSKAEQNFFDKYLPEFRKLFPNLGVLWKVKDHWNHMHIDTSDRSNIGSSSGGGGGFFDIDFFLKPFKDMKNKIVEKMTGKWKGSPVRQIPGKAADKILSAPIKWIKDNVSKFTGGGGEGSVSTSASAKEAQAAVRQVAKGFGWGDGAQWQAILKLVEGESSWNPKAANPGSSARGLFQKMTSMHGAIESTVEGQARWGLNYIKNSYGTPGTAYNKWLSRSPHWYRHGGHVFGDDDPRRDGIKPTLYDTGGVVNPGTHVIANKTKRPEYILNADDTETLLSGGGAGGRDVKIYIDGSNYNPQEISNEVASSLLFDLKKSKNGVI